VTNQTVPGSSAAIDALPPLRDVIAQFGLDAEKRLGQHFLLDLNLTHRIARAAGDLTKGTTLEIGPGPGGLTRALLACGANRVVAVEKDSRCVAALAPLVLASEGRLALHNGDALVFDPTTLSAGPCRIVANLPYNVATPLLVGWLKTISRYESLTLMFQREVAERIVAPVGSDAYGRLSVLTGSLGDAEILFDIHPRAFTPPPKVVSTVVRITPKPNAPSIDVQALETVTAAAFGQRRKMLRASLKSLGRDPLPLLEAAKIDPTARAETIDIPGFQRLTEVWKALYRA
jgi:16S rRNA (adenine1518-N6/adenine1519-N6)-dimethyltransferase